MSICIQVTFFWLYFLHNSFFRPHINVDISSLNFLIKLHLNDFESWICKILPCHWYFACSFSLSASFPLAAIAIGYWETIKTKEREQTCRLIFHWVRLQILARRLSTGCMEFPVNLCLEVQIHFTTKGVFRDSSYYWSVKGRWNYGVHTVNLMQKLVKHV